jgi:hypothetical protein
MCFGLGKTSLWRQPGVLWRHPGVRTALCTYVFLWKPSVGTPGWRQMMAYFHVSTRKISYEISSEWPFWSSGITSKTVYDINKMEDNFEQFTALNFAVFAHTVGSGIITPRIFSSKMLYFGWWKRLWLNLYDRYGHMETRGRLFKGRLALTQG